MADQPHEVAESIRHLVGQDLDFSLVMTLAGLLKKVPPPEAPGLRLAILGGFTTQPLCELIRLQLFALGVSCTIYEADFGVYRQELLDPASALHAFAPDVVYLAVNRHNLGPLPRLEDSPAQVEALLASEVAGWATLWQAAQARLRCQVIQDNVDPPAYRTLGNHELRHHAGVARYLARLNLALVDAAPAQVTIHDVAHLAAAAGRWKWSDPRYHFQAKLPCAPEMLVGYAHSLATVIAAQRGRSRKCQVLDLDNTLWGGEVGDDLIDGIRRGQGDPVGEAFLAFQHYLDDLRRRGVILAVCSKNDERLVREVFRDHPEMVLRLEHIACLVANWQDKASNLRTIAQTLEIGLDALVLLDDQPAERELVRRLLPEVAVPELPSDVSGYIQALDRHQYFQTTAIAAEDLQRSSMYQANTVRRAAESSAGRIDDFLASLEMVATISPVTAANAERVAQLRARSNQFNLTTRRHGAARVLAMASDPAFITIALTQRDRFGDNGLVSLLLAEAKEQELRVDSWIMSCRVLKRGVERLLLNLLCRAARERAATAIIGEYIPTAKNALVRDHYRTLGFAPLSDAADGSSLWRLALGQAVEAATAIAIASP